MVKECLQHIISVATQVAISCRVEWYRLALDAQREAPQNESTHFLFDRGANGDRCPTKSPDWGWALEVF